MKKLQSRLLLFGSIGALALIVMLGGAALLMVEDRPAFRLPDGTRIQVDRVDYGHGGPLVYGPAWKRRLLPLTPYLPTGLADRIRAKSVDLGGKRPQDGLTVWLEYNGDWGPASPFCILRDGHGCRFRAVDNFLMTGESGSPYACLFPSFPRREGSFQVDAYVDLQKPRHAGNLEVASPPPTQYPTWNAERLPTTKQNGPLTVTLKDVTTGWCCGEPSRAAKGEEPEVTGLELQLGAASRDWKVVGVKLSDAMGGNYEFGLGDWWSETNRVYVQGNNLCRQEPAYRYELEFSRAEAPGVAPERQYFLGTLDAVLQTSDRQEELLLPDGRKLRVAVMGTRNRQTLCGDWKPGEGELGRLWVEGKLHRRNWTTVASSPLYTKGVQYFELILPPGLTRPQLYFGTHRSRFVTFTVKPKWVTK